MVEVAVAIGLMSGTSLDGIDVALIETDGENIGRLGPSATYAYDEPDRETIRAALAAARGLKDRMARPPTLAKAERVVTERHAAAVERFIEEAKLDAAAIAVVGFHGQTVLHEPLSGGGGVTVQLGDGAALARRLAIPVVSDMRAADMAAGGQGAPLAPVFHHAMARRLGIEGAVAFLNIGGVANVTLVPDPKAPLGEGLVAFDTGPGNALMDDWVSRHGAGRFDAGGALARSGIVARRPLEAYLEDGYFASPPPKSLDRDHFSLSAIAGLGAADGAATLCEFSARSIAVALSGLSVRPRRVLVTGGGAHNAYLLERVRALAGLPVADANEHGFDGDAIEAQAFALLAVRSKYGLPLSFPGTTGVSGPLTGGRMDYPEAAVNRRANLSRHS